MISYCRDFYKPTCFPSLRAGFEVVLLFVFNCKIWTLFSYRHTLHHRSQLNTYKDPKMQQHFFTALLPLTNR